MTIIVEVPHNSISGGVERMIRMSVELPFYSKSVGGITESIKFAGKINANLRFQRLTESYPQIDSAWTVGLPDHTFPECDICITYSDNPYLKRLVALPQVERTFIYMLSYGMCIERERANATNRDVTVMCSTKKIEQAILNDGGIPNRIGFALDMADMGNDGLERNNYLAIYYSDMHGKRYDLAVKIADKLYKDGVISGVLSFGAAKDYMKHKHPIGLKKHFVNATRAQVRWVFNNSKSFLMPSISEGLNLTPIESALCGCPSIIVDGAIDEIFFNGKNCYVMPKDSIQSACDLVEYEIANFDSLSNSFALFTKDIVKDYTWDKVVDNFFKLI